MDTSYIRVELSSPVPKMGEVRLRIEKTYKDAKTYYREADRIVFDRSLSVPRNTIVLPPQYEVVSCSVPAQITVDEDGRIAVSIVATMPASRSEVRGLAGRS